MGVVLYMNATQARIDDLRASDAIGRTVTDLYRVDEGTSPTMTCLETGKAIENLACYYRTHRGKVVNSIHNRSPRKTRPYVAINCAAIPENLLEGMLFGTSMGAFTGTIDRE